MQRSLSFLPLVILLLGAGLGVGLGVSETPSGQRVDLAVTSVPSAPARTSNSAPVSTNDGSDSPTPLSLAAAVTGGRFVAAVTMGGLTIDPAPTNTPAAPLGLDQTDATAYVGYTSGVGEPPSASSTPTVGFGLVTVEGVASPGGTPILQKTPAWVGIVLGVNEGAFSCPLYRSPTSTTEPFQPEDRAVIFYGGDGRGALLYDTGGSAPCPGEALIPPSLKVAGTIVPVPWQQQGTAGLTTTISYQAPQCATLSGVGTSGNVHTGIYSVEVDVTFPFSRTGCDAVQTFTTTVSVYPVSVGSGAPPSPTTVVLVPSTAPGAVPPALVGPISS